MHSDPNPPFRNLSALSSEVPWQRHLLNIWSPKAPKENGLLRGARPSRARRRGRHCGLFVALALALASRAARYGAAAHAEGDLLVTEEVLHEPSAAPCPLLLPLPVPLPLSDVQLGLAAARAIR